MTGFVYVIGWMAVVFGNNSARIGRSKIVQGKAPSCLQCENY